jgi:hypothetical protein
MKRSLSQSRIGVFVAAWRGLIIALFCAFPSAGSAGETIDVAYSDLGKSVRVIGALGMPLGTFAMVEAELVAGPRVDPREYFDRTYFLRVIRVRGIPLEHCPVLRYDTIGALGWNPTSPPESLSALQQQLRNEATSAARRAELMTQFDGKVFKLLVYETGSFEGGPREEPPEGVFFPSEMNFSFITSLKVISERDPSDFGRFESSETYPKK